MKEPMKATRYVVAPARPMVGVAKSIRELRESQTLLIRDGSASSVRTILTRLRKEFKGKRDWTSKKIDGGVRVWRLA